MQRQGNSLVHRTMCSHQLTVRRRIALKCNTALDVTPVDIAANMRLRCIKAIATMVYRHSS